MRHKATSSQRYERPEPMTETLERLSRLCHLTEVQFAQVAEEVEPGARATQLRAIENQYKEMSQLLTRLSSKYQEMHDSPELANLAHTIAQRVIQTYQS